MTSTRSRDGGATKSCVLAHAARGVGAHEGDGVQVSDEAVIGDRQVAR